MEFDYQKVPLGYAHCINRDCPLANRCLRQLAAENAPEEVQRYIIVNPKATKKAGSDCPFYRDAAPKRFGRGMLKLLDNVPSGQIQLVRARLISDFGRSEFYRKKNGQSLISSDDQAKIEKIIQTTAPTVQVTFDSYEETTEF